MPLADGSFSFPVTQAQLAEILGITSVYVNRMVRSLREKGLATISKSAIAVHDRPALERLAEFSSDYLHLPAGWRGGGREDLPWRRCAHDSDPGVDLPTKLQGTGR